MSDATPQGADMPNEAPTIEDHLLVRSERRAENKMVSLGGLEQYSTLSGEDDSEDNMEEFHHSQIYAHQQRPHPVPTNPVVEQLPDTRSQPRLLSGDVGDIDPDAATDASSVPTAPILDNASPAMTSERLSHAQAENTEIVSSHAQRNTSTNTTPSQKRDVASPVHGDYHHVPPTPTSATEQISRPQHPTCADATLGRQPPNSDERASRSSMPEDIVHHNPSQRQCPGDAEPQLDQDVHDDAVDTTMQHHRHDPRWAESEMPQPEVGDMLNELHMRFQEQQLLRSEEHQKGVKWQKRVEQEKKVQADLRSQVSTLQSEKEAVIAAAQQQKTKFANCEAKVNKFRSFITGLGNDMDSLKKQANANRQDSERVFSTQGEHQAKLEGLLTEMSSRADKSTQLQNEAMKLCREANAELTAARLRSTHLEEQLEMKSRQLVEEKDHREQVQSQLALAATSHDTMNRELLSSRDAVLDKLGEVEIILEESGSRDEVADMLNKTFQAVQDVSSNQTSFLDDILSLRGMLENLSEFLSALPQQSSVEAEQVKSLQSYLDSALESIKSDLASQDKVSSQHLSDQKTISDLQADLRSRDARIREITSQLKTARETATELTNQKTLLQEKVTKLENDIAAAARNHEQLEGVKAKLAERDLEMSTMRSNAELQVKELSSLTASNVDLQKQLDGLEQRLQNASANPSLDKERAELKRTTATEVEKVRQKMSEQASTFHASEKSKAENIQKALRSEVEKLRGEVQRLKSELALANGRIEELEHQNNGQLDMSKLLADSQKEIKEMRTKMASLEQDDRSTAVTMKELENVRSQLAASQTSLLEMTREKDVLKEDIISLQQSTQEAKSSEEKIKKKLQQEHTAHRDATKALQIEIQTTKDAYVRDAKLAEEAKQAVINEEKTRHKNEVDVIQQRLNDSEDTMKKAVEAAERARAEAQEEHAKCIAEINDRVLEVERERDEILAELESARNQVANANDSASSLSRASQDYVPPITKDMSMPRKRKVLNRNNLESARHGTLDEVARGPPESSQPCNARKGPIVPDSQCDSFPQSSFPQDDVDEIEALAKQASNAQTALQMPRFHVRPLYFSGGPIVDESQQLDTQASAQVSRGSVVQESQQIDAPAWRGPIVQESQEDSGVVPASQLDEIQTMLDEFVGEDNVRNVAHLPLATCSSLQQSQRVPESPVLEHRGGQRNGPLQLPGGFSRSSLHEPETHVHKRIMPPPNSSSKRVRPSTGESSLSDGSRSQSQRVNTFTTPEPEPFANSGVGMMRGKSGFPSSSPGFLDTVKDGRHTSTYSGKTGQATSHSTSKSKRKASSQVVDGGEPARKRKSNVTAKNGATSKPAPRLSSQMMAAHQPSSQSGKVMNIGASSIGARTPAPARMHGQSSSQPTPTTRQTRSRTSSKNKEMSETFARHSR